MRLLTAVFRLFWLFSLVGCSALWAAEQAVSSDSVYLLQDPASSLKVGEGIDYLLGRGEESFEQIAARPAADWQSNRKNSLNLGTRHEGAWVRFDVRNQAAEDIRWLLEITWPLLDRVEVRLFNQQTARWSAPMLAGDALALSARPLKERFLVFPLALPADQRVSVYLHVHAAEPLILPMQLISETRHQREEKGHLTLIYLFFGGMLAILLYNSCLYLFTRDRSYIFYSLYLAAIIGYELSLTGMGQLYFWSEVPRFSAKAYGLFAALSFLASTLFARYFLKLREYGGWVYTGNSLTALYWAALLLPIIFYPPAVKYFLPGVVPLLTSLYAVAITIYLWYRGNVSAKLFTLAWALLIFFTIIHLLALNGVLPLNTFTLGSQMIGVYAEFILLSIALAERINRERAERIEAQASVLVSAQKLAHEREEKLRAQQQALAIQREANDQLERRVGERTQALEATKQELEKAIEELARLSLTDPLTQLFNRRHFDACIRDEAARAKRTGIPLSVLIVDVDHFKSVNDSYGHLFGDECLRRVAEVLRGYAQRAGDMAARYGGEEFILLLPVTDIVHAAGVAEAIRQAIEALELNYQGVPVRITVSIGVAALVFERHENVEVLVKAADDALYRAKRNGRNQIVTGA